MAKQTNLPKDYENNPFFIATTGLSKFFDLARGIAIIFVILSIVMSFAGNGPVGGESESSQNPDQFVQTLSGWTPNEWITTVGAVVIIGLALVLLAALFGGVSAYTSAQLANNKKVSMNEAFKVSFDHLWSFLWLQIIIFVKLLLWTLLFIIPGIIMSVRYSLSSVAFFDKGLRGNAAIKESLRLTKGAWITTFAGNALLNYLTLGVISLVITTGANAVLYRQFTKLGDDKPAAHWLSWLTLVLPFVLVAILIFFVIVALFALAATGGKFSE